MLAVLLYLELLSFGVTGMDVRSRFLVLIMPLIAVFAGSGHPLACRHCGARLCLAARSSLLALWPCAIAIVTVGYLSAEQASAIVPHRDLGSAATWRTRWSPPVALSSLAIDRNIIAPDDLIVTNDELAALLILGRVDYWWPPDPTSAERYAFTDQRGGQVRGALRRCAGANGSSALRLLIQYRHTRGVVVALFNTGKFGFDPSTLQG